MTDKTDRLLILDELEHLLGHMTVSASGDINGYDLVLAIKERREELKK